MKAVFAPKYKFDTKTLLEKVLPGDGKIIVSEGETVNSFDILAKCKVREEEQSFSYEGKLTKKKGDFISQGETVASGKKSKSLFTGYISKIDENIKEISVKKQGREISLMAGVPGVVRKILDNKSVLLELPALRVFGVAGYGDSVSGELVVIGNHNVALKDEKLDISHIRKIIVCGYLSKETYAKAKAIGVGGFICGSADASFFTNLKMGGPDIVVLEGFGDIPAFPLFYDYLRKVAPRYAVLRSCENEIIVPEQQKPDWAFEEKEGFYCHIYKEIKDGDFVQVLAFPYYGFFGTVVGLSEKLNKVKVAVWEKDIEEDFDLDDILLISAN